MILETEKVQYVAVENETLKLIEITSADPKGKVVEVIESGPQGPKGDQGDPLQIFSGGVFIGLASKVNFSAAIKAVLEGDTINVSTYEQTVLDFVLTQTDVAAGQIELPAAPLYPGLVRLIPQGGVEQINGIDFIVQNKIVSWKDKGLDEFLEASDKLVIIF